MSKGTTVTLADILELRSEGLKEEEVWCLLCQSVQALQDLFLYSTDVSEEAIPYVSPKTLQVSHFGRVTMLVVRCDESELDSNYLPPEYLRADRNQRKKLDREKSWIYALGRTLASALARDPTVTEFGRLSVVLQLMTKMDPALRSSLMTLFEIISEYCKTRDHMKPFSHLVACLHREVLGFPRQLQCLSLSPACKKLVDESSCKKIDDEAPSTGEVAIKQLMVPSETIKRNPVQRAPSRLYCGSDVPKIQLRPTPSTCTGPEFIVRGSEAPKTVFLGNSKHANGRKLTVMLLTGEKLDVICDPHGTLCGQVFESCVRISRLENDFIYGLALLMNGEFVFVPHETKVHKVACSEWKDGKKSKECKFLFYLRVRFFLPDLRGIKSRQTKHLMYLQSRRNLLERQITGEPNELVNLAGLALQAEFGDFHEKEHGNHPYFLVDHYYPEDLIDEIPNLEDQLQQAHKSRSGLDRIRAEETFLSLVQRLPEYGSHVHSGVWVKKSGNVPVLVSVSFGGISVGERQIGCRKMKLVDSFTWKNVKRLSCNQRNFRLILQDLDGEKTTHYKLQMDGNKSFFLLSLAAVHHRFFIKLRVELNPLSTLAEEFGIFQSNFLAGADGGTTKRTQSLQCSRREKRNSELEEERQNKENESPSKRTGEKRPLVKMGVGAFSSQPKFGASKPLKDNCDAYVIDSSIKSCEDDFTYDLHETIPLHLANKFSSIPWENERVLRKVYLAKDKYGSFGLEVAEGPNGGIFVENRLKIGSENEMEAVRKGDELIAVNGVCLLSLSYSEALNVLKNSGNEIEILLSRTFKTGIEARNKKIELECLRNIRYDTADETDNLNVSFCS